MPTGVPLVLDPLIPGWNPVRSVNRGAVYDAPPAWEVLGEGVQIGFGEPGEGGVGSTGAATLGERDCAGGGISWRAIAVVRHETTISLAEAAKVNAELWAGKAYLDDDKRAPTLSTGSPESITTLSGLPATVVRVAVTSASSGPCLAAKGAVYAVAANGFTGELGPIAVLVVVADVGESGAAAESEIRQILSTLRPLGGARPK